MVDGSDRDLSTLFESANSGDGGEGFEVLTATSGAALDLSGAEWILKAAFDRQGYDLVIEGRDGERLLIRDYFSNQETPDLDLGAGMLRGHVVERLAGPMAEGYAQVGASDASAIGTIDNVNGEAWISRVDGSRELVTAGTSVHSGDVVETSATGSLVISFIDNTSLALSEDARMVIDELVFDPGSTANTASFSLVQGLFVLVSGDVAKTGDMTIETPVSTIGIRGTSVAIQAAAEGLRNLITLLADPDGNVGIVEVATLVARVILDTLGASTVVTSPDLAPSPVEVLTAEQIETAYRAALSTMQTLTGTSLGVQREVEGETPDTGNDASVEDVEAFYQAVQDLIAALQNVGVDGEDLTEAQEDALVSLASAVVIPPKPLQTFLQSLPEKIRNELNSGSLTDPPASGGNAGGDGTLMFVNNSTDSFGTNSSAQFGVAASGALGTQTNNPTIPPGFVNTDKPGGFFFNPYHANDFSDPITSGTPNSGYTISYEPASLDHEGSMTTVTGKNANTVNDLDVSTTAQIHENAVVALSSGRDSNIELTQAIVLTAGTSYIVVEVLLKNLSDQALTLYYLQSINPNQDAVGGTPTQETYNQVLGTPDETGGAIVVATGPNSGVDFVMFADQAGIHAANDELDGANVTVRASVSPTKTFEDDPTEPYLYAHPDPGGSQADVAINLTYLIEALGAGESAYLSFVLSLNIASSIDDFLFAMPGHTTVDGLAGDDTILGSNDNDLLIGNSGDDQLHGGDGDDVIYGGTGSDDIYGDDGDDLIVWQAGDGSDYVDGGDGFDVLALWTAEAASATVSLTQNGSNDVIVGVDGAVAVVAHDIEQVSIVTGSGDDALIIGNLLGTGLGGGTVGSGSLDVFIGTSGADRIWFNDGDATFSQSGQTLFYGNTTDVVLGDFNGDGSLDAIVSNGSTSATILFNNGDGTFSNGGSLGSSARALGTGDFDGDGDLDIFLANSSGGGTVFSNDGGGTFTDTGQSLAPDLIKQDVAVGDVDGDGKLDLVVVGFQKVGPSLQVLLNDGEGTFAAGSGVSFGGTTLYRVALADLDGDDDLDAIVTSYYGAQVLKNDGQGNFSLSGGAFGGADVSSVALGDLDGDGLVDVVVAGHDGLQVFLNSGSGAFVVASETLTGSLGGTPDVVLGDLDGDGDLDIFLANGSGADRIFINLGDGSFVAGQTLSEFHAAKAAALGDLDGDGEAMMVPAVVAELGDGDDTANAAIAGVAVAIFGEGGDDTLIGGVAGDVLDGGSGDDVLAGNLGDDTLYGQAGNDVLQGGAGDDTLYGGGGNDTLDGGFGHDLVLGGSGNDLMLWEAGADAGSSDGSDEFNGGSGDDTLRLLGHSGDDTFIITGEGLYNLVDDPTFSIEHIQSGDDLRVENTERLEIMGGDGSDRVTITGGLGHAGVQTVLFEGGAGDDMLDADRQYSGSVAITAFGGDGDDVLIGGHGNDLLVGGDDNDAIHASRGNDRLYGGDGDDEFIWYGGATYGDRDGSALMDGGDGFDVLTMRAGFNTPGSDVVFGMGGLLLDSGQDGILIDMDDGSTQLHLRSVERVEAYLGDGADSVTVTGDLSEGGIGSLFLRGNGGNDVFDAGFHGDGGFNVTFLGGGGNDVLVGSGGDDLLDGGAGNDLLFSAIGTGNDRLYGGSGTDTAVIYGTSGNDSIQIHGDPEGNVIVSSGAQTIVIDEVEELVIIAEGGDDTVIVGSLDGTDVAWSTVTIHGGDGVDTLGSYANLSSGLSADLADRRLVLFGGAGTDGLAGGTENDILDGGDGDDVLIGFGGDDTIFGGAGNDTILWFAELTATHGNDTFTVAGGGSDVIDGGSGDRDGIALTGWRSDGFEATVTAGDLIDATLSEGLAINVVSEGDVIEVTNVEILSFFNTLFYDEDAESGDDRVVLEGDLGGAGLHTVFFRGGNGNDTLMAADATGGFTVSAHGGRGDDHLFGADGDDHLFGGAGNDTLAGGRGNDLVDGGSGNDVIIWYGGSTYGSHTHIADGDDVVHGGEGYDILSLVATHDGQATEVTVSVGGLMMGGANGELIIGVHDGEHSVITATGIERLDRSGGVGNDVMVIEGDLGEAGVEIVRFYGFDGDDVFDGNNAGNGSFRAIAMGGAGNDVLIGTGGDDILDGGAGNDVLVSGMAAGNDVLIGGYGYDTAVIYGSDQGNEVISVHGDSANDVIVAGSGTVLVVSEVESLTIIMGAGNDTVTLANLQDTDLHDAVTVFGGAGNDRIDAYHAGISVVLYGGAGNDELEGSQEGDHLDGGDGDDRLFGFAGNDVIQGGDGNDTIFWYASGATFTHDGDDIVDGGSGRDILVVIGDVLDDDVTISSGSLDLWSEAGGLLVDVASDGAIITAERVEVFRMFGGDGNDRLVIADDVSVGGVTLVSFRGGAGDDLLDGGNLGEGGFTIDAWGGTGNDVLWGGGGNDTLLGEEGDDVIDGGNGDDVIDGGDGDDRIGWSDGAGSDDIDGGAGFDTLVVTTGDVGSSDIELGDGASNNGEITSSQDNVTFRNIERIEIEGGGGNDTITINALAGAGVVSIVGSLGAGNDVLNAQDADVALTIAGGAGDDTIDGGHGDDTLQGDDGDDSLFGGAGNNTLHGGAGNDLIVWFAGVSAYDSAGNDIVDGGSDNDILRVGGSLLLSNRFHIGADNGLIDSPSSALSVEHLDSNSQIIATDIETLVVNGGIEDDEIYILADLGDTDLKVLDLRGGDGDDIIDAQHITSTDLFVQIAGGAGNDVLIGGAGHDVLAGGTGNDELMGGYGNDTLDGGDGDDVLDGQDGDDTLLGGDGDDTLMGGAGADVMVGGNGNDVFLYQSTDDILEVAVNGTLAALFPEGASLDQILDFVSGSDLIVFESGAFGDLASLVEGLNFSIIAGSWDGTNAGTNEAFDLGTAAFIYSQADSVLYYDNNGSDDGYYAVAHVDQPVASDMQFNVTPV